MRSVVIFEYSETPLCTISKSSESSDPDSTLCSGDNEVSLLCTGQGVVLFGFQLNNGIRFLLTMYGNNKKQLRRTSCHRELYTNIQTQYWVT